MVQHAANLIVPRQFDFTVTVSAVADHNCRLPSPVFMQFLLSVDSKFYSNQCLVLGKR